MRLRPATIKDLFDMYPEFDSASIKEAEFLLGLKKEGIPLNVLMDSVVLEAYDGTLCGIAGLKDHCIWMWTTNGIKTHTKEFMRFSKFMLKELLKTEGYLENLIHINNKDHIKWLKILGAKFYKTETRSFLKFQFKESERRHV